MEMLVVISHILVVQFGVIIFIKTYIITISLTISFLFSRQQKKNKSTRNDTNNKFNQNKIDSILDKISESGYDSLSKQEKEYLFKAGKKK